jgi:sensor histidine kinase YesM
MYHKDCLKIKVEDNGIGRERSMEMQAKKGRLHKSFGLEIVRKRISSLNKLIGQKIWLEILDLKDDEGKGCGTLVEICIPYKSI